MTKMTPNLRLAASLTYSTDWTYNLMLPAEVSTIGSLCRGRGWPWFLVQTGDLQSILLRLIPDLPNKNLIRLGLRPAIAPVSTRIGAFPDPGRPALLLLSRAVVMSCI